jgi:hypothetical protein
VNIDSNRKLEMSHSRNILIDWSFTENQRM